MGRIQDDTIESPTVFIMYYSDSIIIIQWNAFFGESRLDFKKKRLKLEIESKCADSVRIKLHLGDQGALYIVKSILQNCGSVIYSNWK